MRKRTLFLLSIIAFLLAPTLLWSQPPKRSPQVVMKSPIEDRGKVEVTVIDIYHPANPDYDYAKIRIDKVLDYQHDNQADYQALKEGDIIPVYFQWGAREISVDLPAGQILRLPGVKIGDKIVVEISGNPNVGNGWTLYRYSLVSESTANN